MCTGSYPGINRLGRGVDHPPPSSAEVKLRVELYLYFTSVPSTSFVVWWSEFLTTNHEVPGSIPGSTMGIFPCRGRIPLVTMVWEVSRIRLKDETSVTRSHNSINSDLIHDRDLLTTRDSQHISSYST